MDRQNKSMLGYFMPVIVVVLLSVGLIIWIRSAAGGEKDDTSENESSQEELADSETVASETYEFVEEDPTVSFEIQSDEDIDVEVNTGDLASISGKFCYPEDPIPNELRVYLKKVEGGEYIWYRSGGRSTWSFDEVEPGFYTVYLAGEEGSELMRGDYVDTSGNIVEIEIEEGDNITDIEPCNFDVS